MGIAHVAVWAEDLERLTRFYEWLGAQRGERYDNERTGFSSYFLSWPDSMVRLEVMHRPDIDRAAPGSERVGWAHIALDLTSPAEVDRLAAECAASGVTILDGPRRTGDGYYECVITDPEGNRVELSSN